MKKAITHFLLYTILGLVLVSCGSKLSLAKRHYNRGYYITRSDGKHGHSSSGDEERAFRGTVKKPVFSIKTSAEREVTLIPVQISARKENTTEVSKELIPYKTFTHKAGPGFIHEVNAEQTKQIKQVLLKTEKTATNSSDRDGLSLFWIIILVILILWAIGFLAGGFGLGGLINILLVIALVLLILWLLRIL